MGGAIPITLVGILRSEDKNAYHVSTWVADGDPLKSLCKSHWGLNE
jgi:hypothetical protein